MDPDSLPAMMWLFRLEQRSLSSIVDFESTPHLSCGFHGRSNLFDTKMGK